MLARALLSITIIQAGLPGLAGQAINPPSAAEKLTAAQARADFTILRGALEEAHGALYRFSSKADLNRRFDAYRSRLDHDVTQREFIALVSEMVADIRDGHSRLEYDDATTTALAAAWTFPLRVSVEENRLMVMSNDTPGDSTIRPGMEILRINGQAASDVLQAILPKLPGDGFIESGKNARLGRSFGLNYWLFVDQGSDFTIMARDPAGITVTTTLAGVRIDDRDKNQNPVNAPMRAALASLDGSKGNIALRFIGDEGIGHLRIRGFGSPAGQDFRASLDTVFRTLREKGTRALILDLRGNGGGVDEFGARLVAHLVDRPFRYFDRIHVATVSPSFSTWKPGTSEDLRKGVVADAAGGYRVLPSLHSGVAEQQPAAERFLGRLFVLLDGGTFSTAADVTAILRHLKRAVFVGDESGGAYEGNTSGLNALITLPNSGLRLKVQMFGYHNAVSGGDKGRGTVPDYRAPRTTADLLRGLDVPLERALSLAKAGLAGTSP